jgi:hypothetical protein
MLFSVRIGRPWAAFLRCGRKHSEDEKFPRRMEDLDRRLADEAEVTLV